jgi:phosphatidylglycerol---prolipoprotein diacylglyceryl transferase
MIDFTPDPIFLRILGFPIYWYGLAYAFGLAAVYLVVVREARFRGLDENLIGTGLIVVAIAALAGGRLYHVIDQWQLYQAHPITAVLPLTVQPDGSYAFAGFTGLGVPGGIVTGTIGAWVYVRRERQDFFQWADVVAPGLFVMQAIGRWGNFFNQELYGPPTTLPWGIKIDCAHRIADYPCSGYPLDTTHFQPLFLYESLSGIAGALVLIWLARRHSQRLLSGDLLLIFFVWYGLTRFSLETMRHDNWTFFGVPTAQIVTLGFVAAGLAGLWYRHSLARPALTAADLIPEASARDSGADEDFWADDEAEDGLDDDVDPDGDDDLESDDPDEPAEEPVAESAQEKRAGSAKDSAPPT